MTADLTSDGSSDDDEFCLFSDIKKVKETRRHFEKISADTDECLMKNAQVPRSKPAECEEARNVLTAMKSCFGHVSLDYVFQVLADALKLNFIEYPAIHTNYS